MVAGECSHCHEPLAELELGGRIAGLITLIVAGALIIAALGVDELLRPPLWVHVIVWAPLTIGAVLFP